MKIDIVYTWVDHTDRNWQTALKKELSCRIKKGVFDSSIIDAARFQNRNEIFYSIKSVKKFAPWYNKIYVVTNCRLPLWAENDPSITKIPHELIFPDSYCLPTFNSHAIEACLHRTPNLTEHFIYFNDDVFLSQPMTISDFFPEQGKVSIFCSKHKISYNKEKFRPIDYSIANAVRILEKELGYSPQKKLQHAPRPLIKSILFEIEEKFEKSLDKTRSNKFRSQNDMPLATTLHAYYCAANNIAHISNKKFRYVDIGDPLFLLLVHPWSPLAKSKYAGFCLNEISQIKYLSRLRDTIVRRLLDRMYR